MIRLFHLQTVPLILFLAAFLVGPVAPASEGDDAFKMINEARAAARAGSYLDAIDRLQEAIRMADEGGQKLPAAIAFNNIAAIYRLQKNNLQALHYNYLALKVYNEIDHQNGIAATNRLIGEIMGKPWSRIRVPGEMALPFVRGLCPGERFESPPCTVYLEPLLI